MFEQKKKLIENTLYIDVQELAHIVDGTYEVKHGSSSYIMKKDKTAVLINNSPFKLVKSRTGYGERFFFRCKCKHRVKRIYLVKDVWACRHCHNLTYKIRNLTKRQIELHKIDSRIDRLFNNVSLKGKHAKTKIRLFDDMIKCRDDYARIMYERHERLHKKVTRRWRL